MNQAHFHLAHGVHPATAMQPTLRVLMVSSILVSGCGATVEEPAPTPAPAPTNIIGRVLVTTALESGQTYDRFDVELQSSTTTAANPCADSAHTVGSCCYFAPVRRPPTLHPGSGGGTPATEANAGEIRLVDESSHSTVGTYEPLPLNYANLPQDFMTAPWHFGDQLTVTAAGAGFDAFTVSAPALTPPVTDVPQTILRSQDLRVTWQQDPLGERMSLMILNGSTGAEVDCFAPESQGSVTVAASLLSELAPSGSCQFTAVRETDRYTPTPAGQVEFSSLGWASNFYTLE